VFLLSGSARSPTVTKFRYSIFSPVLAPAWNYDAEIMLTSTGRAWFNCTRFALVSLLVFAASAFASAQNAPAESPDHFTFAPKPGPYPVGFRVVFQYDYSRTFQDAVDLLGKPNTAELARPVQTLIWYPAQKSANPTIVFGDYLALGVKELEPTAAKGSIEALAQSKKQYGDAATEKTWAVKDAAPAPGPFPVLIYAPSFSAPAHENSDLLEYLASNGYIVISSADVGAHDRSMTPDLDGVEAQRGDISFLIGYARTLPQADMSHIAVAGFSWGGISNLFAAARDSRIGALISLDGSARYYPKLVADSGYVHPKEITIPILFFRQGGMSLEDAGRGHQFTEAPNVLNDLTHADLYNIHMYWMYHGDFSSTFQRNPDYWKNKRDVDYSRSAANESYSWVARYVLNFLNAYFKQDAGAKQFLKHTPVENGAPEHLFNVDYRPASGFAPTLTAFRAEVGKRGFDHVNDVYTAFKAANPDFKFDENQMVSWGFALGWFEHFPEAIAIFKFDTVLFPDAAYIYDDLAVAYAKNGQKDLAIASYEKSLAIKPDDASAKAGLEKLKNLPKEMP
jgi:dienelactone hydrolase